jgi:REP element-mobilizing transposase RayT
VGHTFHQLYYHIIWATHSRDPHLFRSYRPQFLEILNDEAKKRGSVPLRHNCMPDHVHLLVRLPPTIKVSEYIGQVKGATSHRTNDEIKPEFKLRWQEGYGVLTLRKEETDRVAGYIDRQEQHHATGRLSTVLETIDIENDDWEGP